MFTLIETSEDLSFLDKELLKRKHIGIDTEFRRTSKDNMKLALIQINDSEEIYLIDCLKINEPKELCSFLFSRQVRKVFHSFKEDIEAIFAWTESKMVNIFDTQLANAFLGGSFSSSYQDLVQEKTGIRLDKSATRTNWLKRPLSDAQLRYAVADVQFLIEMYSEQNQALIESNKLHWLEEEIDYVTSKIFMDFEINHTSEDSLSIGIRKEQQFLRDFNEIVLNISKTEEINSTLLFSKKSQKDFLRLVLNVGLTEAFINITSWRKNLIFKPISILFGNLKNN